MTTIEQAGNLLRTRRLSVAELAEEHLQRIADMNPKLNAFLEVQPDRVRERARVLDQELAGGVDRGPLHGIPIALKDIFATRGMRTTCGSKLFADRAPDDHDSAVVERLNAAGAVIVGKTGIHELCYGITSNNPHFGPVRNPADPNRIPGGSSGGSAAAVVADLAMAAMGSDTGGSIRIPASFCGCAGIKPTYGLVSRYGVAPLGFTMDHMGPLARTVRDTALVLQAIAGPDKRDESCASRPAGSYLPPARARLEGVRVGWPDNFYFDRVDAEVAAAIDGQRRQAERLGATIVAIQVPDVAAVNTVGRVLLLSEAAALYAPYLHRRSEFGADVLALLDQGRLLSATDYINAQRLRRAMQQEWRVLWEQIDCLFTPATPTTAPLIGQDTIRIGEFDDNVRLASTRLVRAINVLGFPALALPAGRSAAGLPIGLQIIGPAFDEAGLLRIGAALEESE